MTDFEGFLDRLSEKKKRKPDHVKTLIVRKTSI